MGTAGTRRTMIFQILKNHKTQLKTSTPLVQHPPQVQIQLERGQHASTIVLKETHTPHNISRSYGSILTKT